MKRVVTVKETVIPDKLIFGTEVFEIEVPEELWIREFKIFLENERVEKVVVVGIHPNVNPATCELCLSDEIIGKPFSETTVPEIYSCISTYNFNNSYFRIWNQVKVKTRE